MKPIILLCLLSFSSLVGAETELKGSPDDLRKFLHPQAQLITLNEKAEKTAYSDKAIIHLVVTTEAKTLSESLAINNNIREKTTRDLIAKGISAKEIKNAKFTSTPQYGLFGKKPAVYEVVNRISVSIFEEVDLRNVAQVADSYDEVELARTEFEHTQKDQFEQQVKEDALQKINNQKAYYEKSLGVKLIPVSFRDAKIQQQPTAGASAVEEVIVIGMRESVSSKYEVAEKTSSSFDEIVYKAELSVDYQVINNTNP